MSKRILSLTTAVLVLSSVQAFTNKTFMMPRPHGVDLPMEHTTHNELFSRKAGHRFGGTYDATSFYLASNNAKELAKYFLLHDKDTIKLPLSANQAPAVPNSLSTINNDIDLGYLVHLIAPVPTSGTAASTAAAGIDAFNKEANISLSLRPDQTAYGTRLDWHQDLSKIVCGLFLEANMPFEYVENNPKLVVNGGTTSALTGNTGAGNANPTAPGYANLNTRTMVTNYFYGNAPISNPPPNAGAGLATLGAQQFPLSDALMQRSNSIGIADIDVAIGYNCFNQEEYDLSFAVAITFPTGKRPTGRYMFEAIHGNGHHYGLGGNLKGHIRMFGDYSHNMKFLMDMKYRYLFESNERRTLGIKGRDWGQYLLLGRNGSAAATPLTPAANVLTLPVNVTPGCQFDGIAGFIYNYCHFTMDLGYNFYWREKERLRLRDAFPENTWAIAARGFDTSAAGGFTIAAANVDGGGTATGLAAGTINSSTINLDSAKTPEQFTHAIYFGLGYIEKDHCSPWSIGVGGKYEWPSTNSAIEQWNAYGKVGVNF